VHFQQILEQLTGKETIIFYEIAKLGVKKKKENLEELQTFSIFTWRGEESKTSV